MINQEVQDLIWDNYYNLSTTAVQAMSVIWDEYANGHLLEWIVEEQGLGEGDLMNILMNLTALIGSMPHKHEPCMHGTAINPND